MLHKRFLAFLAPTLTCLLALSSGCAAETEELLEEENTPSDALLGGNDKLSATSTAFDDRVEAPLAGNEAVRSSFDAGKRVIAGAATTRNPYGYLRKVTSYSVVGDKLILQTVPASLEDALRDGGLRAPTAAEQLTAQTAMLKLAAARKVGGTIDFNPLNLLTVDLGTITTTGSTLRMTPDVSLTASIKGARLNRFEIKVSGDLLAKAALQIAGAGPKIGADHEENIGLPVQIAVVPVFGIPVPVYLQTAAFLGCSASAGAPFTVSTSITATANASVRATYTSGTWGAGYTQSGTLTGAGSIKPLKGVSKFASSFNGSCESGLNFKVLLADVAGPQLKVYASIEGKYALSGTVPTGSLAQHFKADLGGSIEVFGKGVSASVNVMDKVVGTPTQWTF